MPNVCIDLPDVVQSVTRPTIFAMIDQVRKITGMPEMKVFFPGDMEKMQTNGSKLDANGNRDAIFNTDHYAFIEVEDDYNPNTLTTNPIGYPEHIPVFSDPQLGVLVTPVYAGTTVKINFRYSSPNGNEVKAWRDRMYSKIVQAKDINLHSIDYHFQLPFPLLVLLTEIYNKRETIQGYGQTFEEYIATHSTDRLTLVGNVTGSQSRLAITERQARIQGRYDFDSIPEKPQKDGTTGNWTISFAYEFTYDKAIECNVRFPIIVHNQLIDSKFIALDIDTYDTNPAGKQYSKSMSPLSHFESDTLMRNMRTEYPILRIPMSDDYVLSQFLNGTGSIIQALVEVDYNDKRSLFSLKELGDIVIDSDIIDFMQAGEWRYMNKPYESVFQVTLYQNQTMISGDSLTIDQLLKIQTTAALDLRQQHRIRLSIVTDLSVLSKPAIDRLLSKPKAFVKVIGAMNEVIRTHPDFNNLGNYPSIEPYHFSLIYQALTGITTGYPSTSRQPGSYYGATQQHSSWKNPTSGPSLFKDLDWNMVEQLRKTRRSMNNVQIVGIVASHRADV